PLLVADVPAVDGQQVARGAEERAHRKRPAAGGDHRQIAAIDRIDDAEHLPGQVIDQDPERGPAAQAIERADAAGNWRSRRGVAHARSAASSCSLSASQRSSVLAMSAVNRALSLPSSTMRSGAPS